MTKLDCSVTGCMHNAENCCCKNTILVEGKTAQDKCDYLLRLSAGNRAV